MTVFGCARPNKETIGRRRYTFDDGNLFQRDGDTTRNRERFPKPLSSCYINTYEFVKVPCTVSYARLRLRAMYFYNVKQPFLGWRHRDYDFRLVFSYCYCVYPKSYFKSTAVVINTRYMQTFSRMSVNDLFKTLVSYYNNALSKGFSWLG